jgi:dTMP kinase
MTAGRFITFEGGEGTGKSTQIERLAAALAERGVDVDVTREPGGTEGAEAIRGLLVSGATGRWDAATETLLHVAARRDHVEKRIRPALAVGRWVLCDRFIDSTVAYQGAGHGLDLAVIEQLHALIVPGIQPDTEDRYEQMARAFHERVRAAFREIAAREPARCRLIDTTGSKEATTRAIWRAVEAAFLQPAEGSAAP